MHLKFKQIPWEIVIAFVINSFLLVLFLGCRRSEIADINRDLYWRIRSIGLISNFADKKQNKQETVDHKSYYENERRDG